MLQIALGLLFELLLCSLASAAPITAESHGNAWQYGAGGGVLGFIVLVLDIIVFSMSFACYKASIDAHLPSQSNSVISMAKLTFYS